MNRRNFIKGLLAAGAAFSVLPSAGRIWKAARGPIIQAKVKRIAILNPAYVNAPFEMSFIASQRALDRLPNFLKPPLNIAYPTPTEFDEVLPKLNPGEQLVRTPFPARYNEKNEIVPPFIWKEIQIEKP